MARANWWEVGVTFLAASLRVHALGAQSLWMDEVFGVVVARLPAATMLRMALADGVHPPLYYLVQEIAVPLGGSEFAARWPMAMAGVLSVAAMIRLGGKWLGRRGGALAGLLLALSPFAVWYSQEVRMYSLALALWIVVMELFVRLLNRPREDCRVNSLRVAFVLSSACLYLTHLTGLFAPLVQFAFIIVTFRRNHSLVRQWAVLQVFAGLPLLFWLVAVFYRPAGYFGIAWIPESGLIDLVLTLQNFAAGYGDDPWRWAGTFAFAVSTMAGLWGLRRPNSRAKTVAALVTLWLLLPPLATLIFSLRRPAYVDRFLIGSLPALAFTAGAGLLWIMRRVRWVGWGLSVTLAGSSLLGTLALYSNPNYTKEQWRDAAHFVQENERAGDEIVLHFDNIRTFAYYYRGGMLPLAIEAVAHDRPIVERPVDGGRLWLVYRGRLTDAHRYAGNLPADFERDEPMPYVLEWLRSLDPYLIERRDFPGVAVLLFDFPPSWASAVSHPRAARIAVSDTGFVPGERLGLSHSQESQ